jgi:predicted O-linked N-acetylglucosamine transferase (SPINDLY family)
VAVALNPQDEAALKERIAKCQEQLQASPDNGDLRHEMAVLLTDMGTQHKLLGNLEAAEESYNAALKFNDRYQDTYYNLGVMYGAKGDIDRAAHFYMQALERCPLYADAHCNLGVIKKQKGFLDEARQHYMCALMAKPNFELVKLNLATVLVDLGTKVKTEGNTQLASELYQEALLYQPFHADAYYNLGVLHSEASQHQRAVYFYQMAVHFNPNNSRALNNLGIVYKNIDNLEKSVECFMQCLNINDPEAPNPNPVITHALNNLGMIYMLTGKDDEAIHYFQQTVRSDPTYAAAYNNLGVVLRDEGKVKEAIAYYDQCIALCNEGPERLAHHNKLLAANYDIELSIDDIQKLHLDWGRSFCEFTAPYRWRSWENKKCKDKRLVIGYISPDFFYHSVSYFIHSVLLYHNHKDFKIVCFANLQRSDEKTLRFQQMADVWHDIASLNTAQVCRLAVQEEVDILVDLTGHTSNHRLDVFSCKPAPIQFSWIGYPNTTGLPTIDYRFTDPYADPPDVTDPKHYSETLLRLEPCFLCYNPDTPPFWDVYPNPKGPDLNRINREKHLQLTHPEVGPPPCLRTGCITVGTFNSISKITKDVAEVWSRILKQVPEMRVLLKSKPLACERVRKDMTALFTVHGIEAERIHCVGLISQHNSHLGAYNELDICLDCWPYAGTATSCEALYMGCPMVTLKGGHHCQNVGSSLLQTIGFPELVVSTKDEYIKLAVDLARDKDRLAKYRKELRPRMLKSRLCDGETYVQQVERHFRTVWHKYCDRDEAECTLSSSDCSNSTPGTTEPPAPPTAVEDSAARADGETNSSPAESSPESRRASATVTNGDEPDANGDVLPEPKQPAK